EEMDASIASLRESLANMRAGEDSRKEPDFHNSTIDTTRYNDTQAQLDQDISFEKPMTFTSSRPKTSWRKFRSSYTPQEQSLSFNPSHAAKASITLRNSFQPQDASTASKVDDLNKQITGYRIQIKFFKQFLQNLIDKSRSGSNKENDFLDLDELTRFQQSFNGLSPFKTEETTKLETDYNTLLSNYDEIFKLNEDLYENLEAFQSQLQAKETQVHQLNEYIEACTQIVNLILGVLIQNPNTDARTKEALARCMDTDNSSRPLEIKLQVISFEFGQLLNNSPVKSVPIPLNTGNQEETQNHIAIIKELITSIDHLEEKFSAQRAETARLEKDLKDEVEEAQKVKKSYKLISEKFQTLCLTLEKSDTYKYSEELEKVQAENAKLNAINNAVDAKFDEYQRIVDKLQLEVNEFKEFSKNTARNDQDLQGELLESHKALSELHEELNDISEKYRKLQEESSNTISSLTDQLHQGQQEIMHWKAEERVTEKSKKDLDIAVEKQRIYKSENIRLAYKVESLTNDKQSLQSTIRSLTDKVTALTVGETNEHSDAHKRLNVLEYQCKELLAVDVHEFHKLLKSFNKIADDSSVKDPSRKLETLSKKLVKMDETSLDSSDLNYMRELHRSIFDYFARAVEMIVNDHVKLLLKESEGSLQNKEYIDKLHRRIDELNNLNDSFNRLGVEDLTEVAESDSPRTKLRMDELWNRWKSEREARVYESKQANRRLKELEMENSRLRAEL
ncbi:uncharacterized protein CANTADRAFT_29905, partial [Suhomyces tanzawaensis NRRL Y-17324]